MKVSEIPNNMEYDLDPDTLHEVPVDKSEMTEGLKFLQQKLDEEKDQLGQAAIQSLIGAYARILGELELAETNCRSAIETYSKNKKPVHTMLARCRLGAIQHFRKDFPSAETTFRKILDDIDKSDLKGMKSYKDHVLQSYGKLLIDMKCFDIAMEKFAQAFEIRMIKGDMKLMESSQKAMDLTNTLINKKNSEMEPEEESA